MEVSYWSGTKKNYIKKINVNGAVPDASAYVERAGKLYSTAVPQEIDYPVYSISEENGLVTVMLSDARDQYVKYWAYFKTVYRFVFGRGRGVCGLCERAGGKGGEVGGELVWVKL
jgi:inner membrane protein